jgi:hypothetical protein
MTANSRNRALRRFPDLLEGTLVELLELRAVPTLA